MATESTYERITNTIVKQLETGVAPWQRPWGSTSKLGPISRPIRDNGQAYRGINVVQLWCEAADKGYSCPLWMTYQQAKDRGAHVRKGEKGTPVVYSSTFEKEVETIDGESAKVKIPFLRSYTVFNAQQIEGLDPAILGIDRPTICTEGRDAKADAFLSRCGAEVRHGGDAAYYNPTTDHVQLPAFESFKSAHAYYSTWAHELIHWTGSDKRIGRTFGKRFGDEAYAIEELTAELGSAFLSADCGVSVEPREDHAAYLAAWLKVLKADARAIFAVAAAAEKAAAFVAGQKE